MHEYEKLAAELAGEILAGDWKAGTLLPTITELEKRFGVSSATVRGGLKVLTKRGLIYTGYVGGRRGSVVRSTNKLTHVVTDKRRNSEGHHDDFAHFAEKEGRTPGSTFEMLYALPPDWVRQKLQIPEKEITVVRKSHQTLDKEPISRETTWFPRDLAEEVGLDAPENIPQGTLKVLAEAGYQETAHVDEVLLRAAADDDARDLNTEPGTQLLVLIRTGATDSRIIRVTETVCIGLAGQYVWRDGSQDGLNHILESAKP